MGSIVFVHGTGVRKEGYAESLGEIRASLNGHPDWTLHACLWGEEEGAKLGRGGISIPDFDATRADAPSPEDEEDRRLARWAVLYEDPLYELRLLELKPRASRDTVIGQRNVLAEFDPLVRGLAGAGALAASLQGCRLDGVWDDALRELLGSAEYRGALARAERVDTELRETIARALAALALRRRGRRLLLEPMSGAARDALVEAMVQLLGGRDRGVGAWLGRYVLDKLTSRVQRNRGALSENGYAVAGDILLYQARGQRIRDTIASRIRQAEPPVVLLAHSLGGVACVDLLNEQDLSDRVTTLITAGSQAPFFYEINALVSLPFGEALKPWFPKRWLNIYDPRDFLSYLARGVFNGVEIEDLRVHNGEPFPQSHGAYWTNARVWTAIREELR